MLILKSWLKEYVDIKESDEELSDLLTFSGTLVEEVSSKIDSKIITAKIIEISPHPNADRLRLVRVTDGKKEYRIVCGAPNIEAGQVVPLATIGARIGNIEIKEAEIRGEKSFGMLCSPRELGISDEHEGIYILPDDYELGKPLNTYIESDSVFELEITPNRGDCLSHIGVAREISALTGRKLDPRSCSPAGEPVEDDTLKKEMSSQTGPGTPAPDLGSTTAKINIEIQNPEKCFKYCAAVISGVEIKESPQWLKDRLAAVGVNSINNVVDVTNYIMMDLGQPLHAFDKNKISGDKIIVRDAIDGEQIITLDEIDRKLDTQMIVIADERKAIAIAGVMGGLDSGIDETTKDIVLESAVFERKTTRRTAKILNLQSEASYRFERGIDAAQTEAAMFKAARMIIEIAGGTLTESACNEPTIEQNEWIKVEYERINELLGIDLTKDKIDEILKSLGFIFKDEMTQAPSWRHDSFVWQDLAEEVARVYCFKNIPLVAMEKSKVAKKSDYYFKEHLKDILAADGFAEVFTYPFLSEADVAAAQIDTDNMLEVANPVQPENKYMRSSLLPGLFKSIAKNPTFDPVMVFEFGNVFDRESENTNIAVAISGKGAREGIEKAAEKLSKVSQISLDELNIREFSRDDLVKYKIKKAKTYVFEIEAEKLIEKIRGGEFDFDLNTVKYPYRDVSKFPPVNRDLAFLVGKEVKSEEIKKTILEISKNVVLVEIFDEFSSDKLGESVKSVAFHIWLQDVKLTLSDAQSEAEISKIKKVLEEKFGAKLR